MDLIRTLTFEVSFERRTWLTPSSSLMNARMCKGYSILYCAPPFFNLEAGFGHATKEAIAY